MRKKYFNFVGIIILFSFISNAQQDAQYTGYMYSVQLFNPAYAGSRGTTSINLIGRTQWLSLEGSPKTSSVFLDTSFGKEDNVGLGLSFVFNVLEMLEINSKANLPRLIFSF